MPADLIGRGGVPGFARWPEAPTTLDAHLKEEVASSSAIVIDAGASDFLPEVQRLVEEFLTELAVTGPVLVKTSTAGDRPTTHEVGRSILGTVLDGVARVAAAGMAVGDGPATRGSYEDECRLLGWLGILQRAGALIVDLNRDAVGGLAGEVPLAATYLNAAAVINLTKAKTHRRFGVSLAEKALLGVVVGSVTGYPKLAGHHRLVPWLTQQIRLVSPPVLSVIDGIAGIEGEGPLRGTPTSSHFVVVGRGCVGPDVLASIEMGFDPALVPHLIRPVGSSPRGQHEVLPPVDWSAHRLTSVDFHPSQSCSWLYRSLQETRSRQRRYRRLLRGAQACWPAAM